MMVTKIEAGDMADRWCILWTAGPRTIALAKSLKAAGIEAWTPIRTFRRERPMRAFSGRRSAKRVVEVDAPILATVVFARYVHVPELLAIAAQPFSPHPGFSIFKHGGGIPRVTERALEGLRREEAFQAELLERLRECETREQRRQERAAMMRTEKARRKAMRLEVCDIPPGVSVAVRDMPAMAGISGVVETSDGRTAVVVFSPWLRMTIETWQLSPIAVHGAELAA
jgi:hypothetical protein